MTNTFITPTVVAKLAIPTLLNNWVFAGLVHRDYAKEFRKIGDSVRIRKPATFTAIEWDGDLTGEWQPIAEGYTDVLMNTVLTVPIEFTQVEQTLKIVNFQTQILEPAMQALAQKVDLKLAELYKDIPYYYDITETSQATIIASLLGARRVQNDLKLPFDQVRYAVMSPLTTAILLGCDAFRDLDKTGATKALREASLGRLFSYEFYENQNIYTHNYGTNDGAGLIDYGANYVGGETTIHVDAFGQQKTILKGSILTIADNTGVYVVTANATTSNDGEEECDLAIYPALNAAVLDGKTVTLHAAATTSKDNLMFHKNAFALVTAPMAPPVGGALGVTETYKGLSLNVVYSYEHNTFSNKMTISLLCGFKTLKPEMAVRLYEAS